MVLLMKLNAALRCLGSSQRQALGWHETDEPPFPAPGTENINTTAQVHALQLSGAGISY